MNLSSPRCQDPECARLALYNFSGQKSKIVCAEHKVGALSGLTAFSPLSKEIGRRGSRSLQAILGTVVCAGIRTERRKAKAEVHTTQVNPT